MSEPERPGMLCRIPCNCSQCDWNADGRFLEGWVCLAFCLGCGKAFCGTCAKATGFTSGYCKYCQEHPEETNAYRAGYKARYDYETRLLKKMLGE